MVFKRLGRYLAHFLPRDLADRGVLRASTRQVDDDELVALTSGLRAVANLADLGVDVRLGHRAVGDRRPELADLGRLLREVADVLRRLEDVGGDLLLRRLVRARADDRRVRLEPALLDARGGARGLRVDDIRRAAHLLRRRHRRERHTKLRGHLRGEGLVAPVGRVADALEVRLHRLGGAGHDAADGAAADEADRVALAKVLERDAARGAGAQVRHEAVLLEDAAGLARDGVHHDENAAARRAPALVEGDRGHLDRPSKLEAL